MILKHWEVVSEEKQAIIFWLMSTKHFLCNNDTSFRITLCALRMQVSLISCLFTLTFILLADAFIQSHKWGTKQTICQRADNIPREVRSI